MRHLNVLNLFTKTRGKGMDNLTIIRIHNVDENGVTDKVNLTSTVVFITLEGLNLDKFVSYVDICSYRLIRKCTWVKLYNIVPWNCIGRYRVMRNIHNIKLHVHL